MSPVDFDALLGWFYFVARVLARLCVDEALAREISGSVETGASGPEATDKGA